MEQDKRQDKQQGDIEINTSADGAPWKRPNVQLAVYLMLLAMLWWQWGMRVAREEIPYSDFLTFLDQGQIDTAIVKDNRIEAVLKIKDEKTGKPRIVVTVPLADSELASMFREHAVDYAVRHDSGWLPALLSWVFPFALLFLFWGWMGRRMQGGAAAGGFLSMGSHTRIHADSSPPVTFGDVAGAEEAKEELKESIEFLKDPSRIQRLGGHMPKGVLLLGPPGTGKTLLARAVSGEAKVPFFNISGSEFIELFVGVGAARVRDLFQQARDKAPCIIFIDELDGIGRSRGGPAVMGGHDEREQTLNQLLTEMDGFDPSIGVVVMAATNRPEVLDKALLRAGRFDRQIVVDKPDLGERQSILQLHASKLTLGSDVQLSVVAQRTPGFVGADLANICNEAAILAVRHNRKEVTMVDFEAAIDRVIAGPEKKHRVLNSEEKRRVAFHESGHALVALSVPHGEPVHKISIIPRGVAALGYTLQLPVEEKFLSTREELRDQLATLLGGRVAEEIVFDDISTGASNDLERASEIARDMVTRLGMCEDLGPLTYGRRQQSLYLGGDYLEEKNYSEDTARQIDAAVKTLVEEAHRRAREILQQERPALNRMAKLLQEKEVISGSEAKALMQASHH
ncbi:ATP-dependent zinc metalloprotease FtsH [Congregibacter variabilis]|uniref:ATP-dependent zinc metalloprotease FtsH n=1 Tax=Congregibacter variabilis TaxID=3081200 RepID=A0ABZ0I0T0_9GAMM|nr:ATP-dependent zinc metalloprotease FtsH [Congregibacter sp. IMCC43200]